MKVKSEREVAQSCLILSDPMDCSLPGSSVHVHGIFQARVLEWVAIAWSCGRLWTPATHLPASLPLATRWRSGNVLCTRASCTKAPLHYSQLAAFPPSSLFLWSISQSAACGAFWKANVHDPGQVTQPQYLAFSPMACCEGVVGWCMWSTQHKAWQVAAVFIMQLRALPKLSVAYRTKSKSLA